VIKEKKPEAEQRCSITA